MQTENMRTWFSPMLAFPCRNNVATGELDALQISCTGDKLQELNRLLTDAGTARKPKHELPGEKSLLIVLDSSAFEKIILRQGLTLVSHTIREWFDELEKKGIEQVIIKTPDTQMGDTVLANCAFKVKFKNE